MRMRQTQEKWLARVQRFATEQNIEAVSDTAWANTGVIRFQPSNSFVVLASVDYGFYDKYCSFTVKDAEGNQLIPTQHGVGHVPYEELEQATQRILAELEGELG